MPNFFYYDASGQKYGPVNDQQLKALAAQGVINPNTPMMTDTGHKGTAGQIPDLFAAPPAADENKTSFGETLTSTMSSTMSFLSATLAFVLVLVLIVAVLGVLWWVATVTNLIPPAWHVPGWNTVEQAAVVSDEQTEEQQRATVQGVDRENLPALDPRTQQRLQELVDMQTALFAFAGEMQRDNERGMIAAISDFDEHDISDYPLIFRAAHKELYDAMIGVAGAKRNLRERRRESSAIINAASEVVTQRTQTLTQAHARFNVEWDAMVNSLRN